MNIKQKFKSVKDKLFGGKHKSTHAKSRRKRTDSELGADEVVKKEVYPSKKKTDKCTQKPLSKRTRPTNPNYRMIDPDDNSVDSGKS